MDCRTLLESSILWLSLASGVYGENRPPNIVVIFTDDQGYQDLGCYGGTDLNTPYLDQMAQEGMRFTDFYVAAPICSPSRASLLTGRYCERTGVTTVLPPGASGLPSKEVTIPELLKQQRYATACVGKWHLGDQHPFLPTDQGFDTYFGVPYSNDMRVNPDLKIAPQVVWREGMSLQRFRQEKPQKSQVPLLENDAVIEFPVEQSTLTQRYTEWAIDYIHKHQDEPFFVYLAHNMPHVPLHPSDRFLGQSARGIYGDVIEELDWSVGQILETLRDLRLEEQTLVVFTSDNGPQLGDSADRGSALPLRGGKHSIFEGGMRVPAIAWWPGHVPPGVVCREMAATIDLLPTFASLARAELSQDIALDGFNLTPLLTSTNATSPRQSFYYYGQGIRVGKWKLVRSTSGVRPDEELPLLFDLEADPGETKNLAADHPETVQRLSELFTAQTSDLHSTPFPAEILIVGGCIACVLLLVTSTLLCLRRKTREPNHVA